jgi:hypothetical protein
MSQPPPEEERRQRRGLKFRKREDYAIELFRQAQASLGDVALVDRLLLQLGRFYNPYVNAPIVDLGTRKQIVAMLERGDEEGARRLLDERLALYARMDDGEGDRAGTEG